MKEAAGVELYIERCAIETYLEEIGFFREGSILSYFVALAGYFSTETGISCVDLHFLLWRKRSKMPLENFFETSPS